MDPNPRQREAGGANGAAATGADSWGTLHLVLTMLLVAVAYYVAARLGLRLALVKRNVTPLWPPTGIAVVAFLVFGRRVWPGVAVAALLVNLPISADPLAALATAAGNTLAPFLAATLLNRVGFHPELDRGRDAMAIVFLGALLSMLVSASTGTAALLVSGAIGPNQFWGAWSVWWTGDAMGVLVVAPFLLSLRLPPDPSIRAWPRRLEAAGLFASLSLVLILVTRSDMSLRFVLVPLLGWAAWRFQLRGAAPAALLVASVASWAATRAVGPFAGGSLLDRMVSLQAFNATVAFSSFFFAAIVSERLRARDDLEVALRNQTKTAEQLRALDASRARFLSAASHELRTPITISRGHIQVLGPDASIDDTKAALAVVLDELERMGRIIDDVSALVRRDDVGFLQLQHVDLAELVHNAATKVQPVIRQRLHVVGSSPAIARVDPQRITQVVLNLLENASAHTPAATPVELRLRDDAPWWRLEVEDSGGGLVAGSEEAVFQPFNKRPRSRGSGLGLAIVKGIAEAHGGAAGVTNRPGLGATFWVQVPR